MGNPARFSQVAPGDRAALRSCDLASCSDDAFALGGMERRELLDERTKLRRHVVIRWGLGLSHRFQYTPPYARCVGRGVARRAYPWGSTLTSTARVSPLPPTKIVPLVGVASSRLRPTAVRTWSVWVRMPLVGSKPFQPSWGR